MGSSRRDIDEWCQQAIEFVHSPAVVEAAATMDSGQPVPAEIQSLAHRLGLTTARLPERYGGHELAMVDYVRLIECVGQGPGALRVYIHGQNSKWEMFERFGTAEQKARYLPTFTQGEWAVSFSLTEPHAGTGRDIVTRAAACDNGWVIDGYKHLVTHAAEAQVIVVLAQLDDSGVTAFLVPPTAPGVTIEPMAQPTGTRGIGLGAVRFTNCVVPDGAMLGLPGQGLQIGLSFLDTTRTALSACAVGLAQRALDLATKHSIDRVTFGKPLAARQAIQIKIADMEMMISAGRSLALRAASKLDDDDDARHEAAVAKRYTARMATDVADAAMQVFGGIGYTAQTPLERIARDARSFWFEEGTDEALAFVIARTKLAAGAVKPLGW